VGRCSACIKMPEYPDRRREFKNTFPWEVAPATPRFDNPKKYDGVVYSRPAIRTNPQGLPRDVRVVSVPKPPEPELPPEPIKPPSPPIPDEESWSLPHPELAPKPLDIESELE
jgi:hypothetical protein